MAALALIGIAGLLLLILMILSSEDDETNKLGTLLTVVGLLGAVAGLTYMIDNGKFFLVVGFILIVIAWITSLILQGPLLIRGGLLVAILWMVYAALDHYGLLIVMLLLVVARLIHILFTDPLQQIQTDAERAVFEHSARYLNNVRRTVRR